MQLSQPQPLPQPLSQLAQVLKSQTEAGRTSTTLSLVYRLMSRGLNLNAITDPGLKGAHQAHMDASTDITIALLDALGSALNGPPLARLTLRQIICFAGSGASDRLLSEADADTCIQQGDPKLTSRILDVVELHARIAAHLHSR